MQYNNEKRNVRQTEDNNNTCAHSTCLGAGAGVNGGYKGNN